MKKIIDFLKKLSGKKCCTTAFVKTEPFDITFDGMKDLKKYFTPFMVHCLNITGIEDLAGVERGTVKNLIAGKKVSDEDLKMLNVVIRMIKNT